MAHDVFISHAHNDKSIADATCAALEQAGIRCWIAPRDIEPGADWGASLMDGLKASKVLVLILSSSANTSPHIRREVERAVHQGTTVVPLRIEDVLPEGALEYHLGTVHWLDAMSPPLEAHLQRLTDIISAILTRMASAAHPIGPEKTEPVPVSPPKAELRSPTVVTPPPVEPAKVVELTPTHPVVPPPAVIEPPPPVREPVVPPSPVLPDERPLSEASRLINIFIAPRKTFADLRRNPRWWPPLLVLLGMRMVWCAALYSFLIRHGFPSRQSFLVELFGPLAIFLTPFIDVIFYAVGAGLWFVVCKNIAGGRDLDFARTFEVALYSRYPWILGVTFSTLAFLGALPFLPLGGAALIPWLLRNFGLANSNPIVVLVSVFDIYNIWFLVLAGLGMSQVSQVKRLTATVVITVLFFLLALLRSFLLV